MTNWVAPARAGKTHLQERIVAELVAAGGFLRAWRGLAGSTTNLQRDPDDPFDPADDPPFTVIEMPAEPYWVRARKLADLNTQSHRSPARPGLARVPQLPCCGTAPSVGSSSCGFSRAVLALGGFPRVSAERGV